PLGVRRRSKMTPRIDHTLYRRGDFECRVGIAEICAKSRSESEQQKKQKSLGPFHQSRWIMNQFFARTKSGSSSHKGRDIDIPSRQHDCGGKPQCWMEPNKSEQNSCFDDPVQG